VYVPATSVRDAASISTCGFDHDARWIIESSLRKPSETFLEAGGETSPVGLDSKSVDGAQ